MGTKWPFQAGKVDQKTSIPDQYQKLQGTKNEVKRKSSESYYENTPKDLIKLIYRKDLYFYIIYYNWFSIHDLELRP